MPIKLTIVTTMITDLISLLFFSRDYAHRAHLAAASYAKHMALESFYTEMTDAVDRLTESYQGLYAVVLAIPYLRDDQADPADPLGMLTKHWRMAQIMRAEFMKPTETMLQNQMDEIERIFAQTVYKLRQFN